jgi:MFS family permease
MNPFQAAPNSKKWLTLIGLYLGTICNLISSTTNSVLLPAAAADIGGMEIYPIAATLPGIITVVVMPLYGYFGAKDPSKKRLLVVISMLAGALFFLVRALAPNMMFVVIFSLLWGLVSAGVFVIGFSMIRDMFEKEQAGTFLGLVGTVMSLGMLIGPFAGGAIISALGWRFFCHIMWILMAVAGLLVLFGVSVSKEAAAEMAIKNRRFDLPGSIAVVVFLGCLILPLSFGTTKYIPFGSPTNMALFAVAAVALILLVVIIIKKGNDAIVPKLAFTDRNTIVFAGSDLMVTFTSMCVTFFVPGYIMRTLAADPIAVALGPALAAGIASALMAVLGLVLGPLFGKLIAKQGNARITLTLGSIVRIIILVGFLLLLKPDTPIWLIYVLMFFAGIYNSTNTVVFSAGPQIQLKPELRVTGNSLIQLLKTIGGSLGMAICTLCVAMSSADGMSIAIIVSLAVSVVLLFFGLLLKKIEPSEADK